MKEVLNKIENGFDRVGAFLYKYRYAIAIILFIVCVVFEINGSSIGQWNVFVRTGMQDNELFGKSRRGRADEWATFTPMMFSQKFDGFHWFSNILCGGNTDVFLIYALPVLNIMQIFRPFQIGFLFLSVSRGLSFFWISRIIFLFLISFEFGMLVSNKNKMLSMTYAFLVTFSPMVQWWFAINGTVELIFFAELAILLLDRYLLDSNFKNRILYLFGMVISAGGFLLVFYPAWQVPVIWVFLLVAIWVFIKGFKNIKIEKRDVISIAVALIVFIACMAYILIQSLDTLKTILNTVYPGKREDNGGFRVDPLLKWAMNIFLPYKDIYLKEAPSETATMFTLFPLGLVLAIKNLFIEKKKDLLTICLLVANAILLGYSIIGFPSVIAKITLLNRTTAIRVYFGTGLLDMILLLRGLSITEKKTNIIVASIFAVLSAILISYIEKKSENMYITRNMFVAMVIMIAYLFFFGIRISSKGSKMLFSIGIIFVMMMSGFTVNPVRVGADDIVYSPILNRVREIDNAEKGVWLVADMSYPIPEYLTMAGVSLINSTNTYPHLDRWRAFDEEGKYENIYNRYAHVRVYIVKSEDEFVNEIDESKRERFELIGNDVFGMYIMPDELIKMNVDYIFSIKELELLNTEKTVFKKLDEINGYRMYKVEYK